MVDQPKKSKYLTVDQIAAVKDIPEEDLEIEAWGGTVRVRGMNAQERVTFMKKHTNQKTGKMNIESMQYDAVLMAVVEPKMTEDHIEMLHERSPGAIDDIIELFMELSGIDTKALIEERKNY